MDSVIRISGYNLIRQDRNSQGGGVALYVKSKLKCQILASSKTEMPGKPGIHEYLFCMVQDGNFPAVFVGVIYRPPKVAFTLNLDFLDDLRNLIFDYSLQMYHG